MYVHMTMYACVRMCTIVIHISMDTCVCACVDFTSLSVCVHLCTRVYVCVGVCERVYIFYTKKYVCMYKCVHV